MREEVEKEVETDKEEDFMKMVEEKLNSLPDDGQDFMKMVEEKLNSLPDDGQDFMKMVEEKLNSLPDDGQETEKEEEKDYIDVNKGIVAAKAEHVHHIHVPVDHNTLLVVLSGEMLVNGMQKVQDSSIVLFAQDDEADIQLEALQDSKFLLLTGQPLNEPIQGYGPFVMNTKDEIIQAFNDFNRGKFGEIAVAG